MSAENKRFSNAMAVAAPAVWDWDIATNTFTVSSGLRALYGLSESELVTVDTLRDATEKPDRQWVNWVERSLLYSDSALSEKFFYPIKNAPGCLKKWVEAHISVDRDPSNPNTVRGITAVLKEVTDRIRADYSLIESEERLRLAVEAGMMAVWEVDLESGKVTNTPELNLLFGFPPDATPSIHELRSRYAPGEVERLAKEGATWEVVQRRFMDGEFTPRDYISKSVESDRTQVQAEVTIVLPTNVTRHLIYRAQYAYSLEGRPKITGFLVDITERKLAEERLSVVVRELHHRFKNSVAVVQALARQSFVMQDDSNSAMQTFLGRLTALSAATDMILRADGVSIDISEIISKITQPYRTGQSDPFSIAGPKLYLSTRTAEALSMILHELCTNALKYGALSLPAGRIFLQWQIVGKEQISLGWKEVSGPKLHSPAHKGYGTKLIQALVVGELSGTLTMDYETSGLSCHIVSGVLSVDGVHCGVST